MRPPKRYDPPTVERQFVPEGYPPLPSLRLFAVIRPGGLPDLVVEATNVGQQDGVLIFTETLYIKHPAQPEDHVQVSMTRRMIRVWLDCEELIGGMPMTSMVIQ